MKSLINHPSNIPLGQLVQIQIYFCSAENARFWLAMKNFISEKCSEFSEKSSIYYAIWWIFLNIYSEIKSKNYENCNINDVTRDLFWNFGHFLPNLSSHFISNMSFIITRQIITPHNFIKFWILKILKNIWTGIGRVFCLLVRKKLAHASSIVSLLIVNLHL